MTFRSPGLLACFLSLLWTSSALAADPLATSSHFQITKSFPVSEATWAEKAVDLYLVAAQRSVLIYRKTGPGEANYQEVNRLFPGLDGAIENCAVAHGRLYVPASTLGLLAYRVADLEQPGAQPESRSTGAKSIGAVSVAGGRVYARYRNSAEGGFGVFDAETLALLGEGLPGVPIFGLSAVTGNGLLNPQGVLLRDGVLGVPTTMEGVRFYSVTNQRHRPGDD